MLYFRICSPLSDRITLGLWKQTSFAFQFLNSIPNFAYPLQCEIRGKEDEAKTIPLDLVFSSRITCFCEGGNWIYSPLPLPRYHRSHILTPPRSFMYFISICIPLSWRFLFFFLLHREGHVTRGTVCSRIPEDLWNDLQEILFDLYSDVICRNSHKIIRNLCKHVFLCI